METSLRNNDILKGTAAGFAGMTSMHYLMTWPIYKMEDEATVRKEKKLKPMGREAPEVMSLKIADAFNVELSDKQIKAASKVCEYSLGVAQAVLYQKFYRKVPMLSAGKGLLYGFGLFLIMDELVVPRMGFSGPTSKYPWQTHVRGLMGHLMYGLTTHLVVSYLDREGRQSEV